MWTRLFNAYCLLRCKKAQIFTYVLVYLYAQTNKEILKLFQIVKKENNVRGLRKLKQRNEKYSIKAQLNCHCWSSQMTSLQRLTNLKPLKNATVMSKVFELAWTLNNGVLCQIHISMHIKSILQCLNVLTRTVAMTLTLQLLILHLT